MVGFIAEKYDYVLNDLGDPRVKDWNGVSSPAFGLSIIAIYLLAIYIFLPAYMKNRNPYSLRSFLYCYNVFQIVCCLMIIYAAITSGLTCVCQPIDYSTNEQAIGLLNCIYYAYILKGIELLETPVFVLRKKFNQVSTLHVYHHISTFVLSWIALRFVGGGMITFPFALNSAVHVLMYTYYLLSSLGEEWQKNLEKWKTRLTMIQMIQFCVLIVHSLQSLHPECHVPKQLLLIYLPDVFMVFYMFWEFYQKNYLVKKTD